MSVKAFAAGQRSAGAFPRRAAAIVACGLLLAFIPQTAGIHIVRVTTGSMAPAIRPGDWAVVRSVDADLSRFHRGDIALFSFPIGSDGRAIKRVVGLAGDPIFVRNGNITVGGRTVPDFGDPNLLTVTRHERVPQGSLFLIGDNAAHSIDSRHFGPVPLKEIYGRVLFPIRPWILAGFLGVLAAIAAGGLLIPHATNGIQASAGANIVGRKKFLQRSNISVASAIHQDLRVSGPRSP